MQNLNDPKLTNQERQQILKLAIDADYRQKVEDAKKEDTNIHSTHIGSSTRRPNQVKYRFSKERYSV